MQVPREVLRGGSTSGAPSALPLFLSPRGGWGYPVSLRGGSTSGAPPSALPLFLSEGWVGVPSFPARGQHLRCSPSALPPWVGLPGPHPGFLSFHDERNQRRAGATAPGPREGGTLSPLRRRRKASRNPPNGGFRHNERPICPPTPSGQTGLLFSRSFFEGTLLAVNLRRGEFEVQDVKKS